MEVFHWLVSFSLLLGQFSAAADKICQNFRFVIDKDVTVDHTLEGHVFKNLTVNEVTHCHMMCRDDCRCISMNYIHNKQTENCELNEVNKEMKPTALIYKPGASYYDLVRWYKADGQSLIEGRDRCVNRCCQTNLCLHGGTCQEICDPTTVRFNCTCPEQYTGKRCEKIKHPRSCKDLKTNGIKTSGMHFLYDTQNNSFPVYCDFDSNDGKTWALIQSFSLANKNTFTNYGFGTNHSVNDDNGLTNWSAYRLSLTRMKSIAGASTHLRATCNFPDDGLKYTDYARAKLEDQDLFGTWGGHCREYELINIRGIECRACTATSWQVENEAWHINSYFNDPICDLDATSGAALGEQNFGRYLYSNDKFRCTSRPNSTTQHWIGT